MQNLSAFFRAIAAKTLSAVEADRTISNQHEFNGTKALKSLLGSEAFQARPTRFLWLGPDEEVIQADSTMSWYDAREKHPIRSEWRLYFAPNAVMQRALPEDLLVVAVPASGPLLCLVANDDTVKQQIEWLFDLPRRSIDEFTERNVEERAERRIGYGEAWILDALGLEPDFGAENIGYLLERFGGRFPTTAEFSAVARELEGDSGLDEDPDAALMGWLRREEAMFRALERHIISERLRDGFVRDNEVDVDDFIGFSLSVQNRRKSRAGLSLENHLDHIFATREIRYVRGAQTEDRKRPDFLFPDIESYRDPAFPSDRLVMLAVKSSCKDRWRQALSEAARIERKHLLTLEPGISRNQTDEMRAAALQLILPADLHASYAEDQRAWLLSLRDFLELVKAPTP